MQAPGFTLIEMLIAVVIIAVVGTTISTSIGGVSSQTYALERRTVANWVALNQITKLRLDLRASPRALAEAHALAEGRSTAKLRMADRQWEVQTSVIATDHPSLRRVEIDVYEFAEGARQGPYDHLVGFIGQH